MAHKIERAVLAQRIRELDGLTNDERSALLELLNTKKFGLVWENKPEDVEEHLRKELPVLTEIKDKAIINGTKYPNHILIEGDNYEALTVLSYSHEGRFDAIYIDPPYNSGARDWRYNNDFVDKEDEYRHSKWLSLMNRRLKIAKRLLNPNNSVLIVTIDEKEYHHLGCLLEELFPAARIQMISSVINVKGVARENEFARVNEYIYIVQIGASKVQALPLGEEWLGNVKSSSRDKLRLGSLLRTGSNSERKHSPGCFYPIYFTKDGKFVKVGEPIPLDVDRNTVVNSEDLIAVWPIHTNGSEGVWQYSKTSFEKLVKDGFVYFGSLKNGRIGISYAPKGVQEKIKSGLFKLDGLNEDGSVKIDDSEYESTFIPGNQWAIPSHNATEYGSKLLKDMFDDKVFAYPKSIYAVKDTLRFFVANNPNATILDFFAGSGTTLHATMQLNEEDKGHRQCILVTNNENNICEEVTYERNKRVINGYTTSKGVAVEGLHGNNLRYYKVGFVPRENTLSAKRQLMAASTDLLCIKNGIYTEQSQFGTLALKPNIARYFEENGKRMLVIFREEAIEKLVAEIKRMTLDEPIITYVFSSNNYAMDADFEEVEDKVSLCALPAAIYNAYLKVLPKRKAKNPENEDAGESDESMEEQQKLDFGEEETL